MPPLKARTTSHRRLPCRVLNRRVYYRSFSHLSRIHNPVSGCLSIRVHVYNFNYTHMSQHVPQLVVPTLSVIPFWNSFSVSSSATRSTVHLNNYTGWRILKTTLTPSCQRLPCPTTQNAKKTTRQLHKKYKNTFLEKKTKCPKTKFNAIERYMNVLDERDKNKT